MPAAFHARDSSLVEVDAGLALERVGQGVVDWADFVGWHLNVDVVEESKQRLVG